MFQIEPIATVETVGARLSETTIQIQKKPPQLVLIGWDKCRSGIFITMFTCFLIWAAVFFTVILEQTSEKKSFAGK